MVSPENIFSMNPSNAASELTSKANTIAAQGMAQKILAIMIPIFPFSFFSFEEKILANIVPTFLNGSLNQK